MGDVISFPGKDPPATTDVEALAHQLMEQAGSPQEALRLLQEMTGVGLFGSTLREPRFRRPDLLLQRDERVCYVVRIDLDGARPPIWRRLRLASDLTLDQVHQVLQIAMGWTDSHLHHFVMGPDTKDMWVEPFVTPFDIEEGEDGIPEADVRLDQVVSEPGHRLFYVYDFGDSWHHTLKLERVEPWDDDAPVAECVAGRRACPPEDVGGLGGYGDVCELLAGRTPAHMADDPEWCERVLAWLPPGYDPAVFSVDDVNAQLAEGPIPDLTEWHPAITDLLLRCGGSGLSGMGRLITYALRAGGELSDEQVAAAVSPYRTLVAALGDGVTLTAAGYLPPRIVEQLVTELDLKDRWIGRSTREDSTYPILQLRESATKLGLARKHRGRLSATNIARRFFDDPRRLLAHIGSRLPYGRPEEQDAGMLTLLYAAADAPDDPELDPISLMADIGWRVMGDHFARAVVTWSSETLATLEILGGRGLWSRVEAPGLAATARALLSRPGR